MWKNAEIQRKTKMRMNKYKVLENAWEDTTFEHSF